MAKKIFIAATGQNCGKTTTSLTLLHMARQKYRCVGFIKPLGPKPMPYKGHLVDKDSALMAAVFDLDEDIDFMSPVVLDKGATKKALDGEISAKALENAIVRATAELEKRCDFLIIEGAGHTGVGSVLGLSNARVAKLLNAPVLMICEAGIGNAVDSVNMNLALMQLEGVDVRLVLANKVLKEKRGMIERYMGLAFQGHPFQVAAGFNYSPILANPTLGRIAKLLDRPLKGDHSAASRIVHNVQMGAASTQRVVDLLSHSTLLLVNSTRDELLVTMASLYHIPEYQEKIVGLVIPGLSPVSKTSQGIVDDSNIPYLRTHSANAAVFSAIRDDVPKLIAEDEEKIDLIETLADTEMDFSAIDALF